MEKKSVVYIILDALCQKSLERKVGNRQVMPFLNQLAEKSVCFTNMYAQAPYTEASEVSLLTGENTLDSGGYLFGNGTVGHSVFQDYQNAGYRTLYTLSPYVYSKSYLLGVDEPIYCRLYSVEPLILYRLGYYRDKFLDGSIRPEEMQVCCILLAEAFDTWCAQCAAILEKAPSAAMLQDWIADKNALARVWEEIAREQALFRENQEDYVKEIFRQWDDHILRKLNKQYSKRTPLPFTRQLQEEFQDRLESAQKRYSKIVKKQWLDLNYVAGMAFRKPNGIEDAKKTVHAYLNHYRNTDLQDYLSATNESSKPDVSLNRMLDTFLERISRYHKAGQPVYACIHAQDFHLPSLFHSLDTEDYSLNQAEMEQALSLLDAMDSHYRGNILADLSAQYCDGQLKSFFERLQKELGEEFIFVVTADHGYPCYENPPRPIVYNQTYTEAFHVPYVAWDGVHAERITELYSDMDALHILKQLAGVEPCSPVAPRAHILCEYGGPGCPDIGVKPIWYTYIDKDFRVSAECPLKEDISFGKLTGVFRLKKDPAQRIDLQKRAGKIPEMESVCGVIQARHVSLREKYCQDLFLENTLQKLK